MDVGRVMALLDGAGERAGLEWFGVAGARLEASLNRDERNLVEQLLADGGYACDDYSEGLWSLDQVRHGRAPGQLFRA